jgi:Tfp pilus assembly protein PilZ
MTESPRRSGESRARAQVKELLTDDETVIANASRAQKRRLLVALEELLPRKESMLDFWLQALLTSKDISQHIDQASESQLENILTVLEDLCATQRDRQPRKPSSVQVTINHDHTAVVRDISASGVFVRTTESFFVGQQITLEFPFPSPEKPVRMTAKVVWGSPLGFGVQFTSPPTEELRKMIEFL